MKRITLALTVALVMVVMLSVYVAALAYAKGSFNEGRDASCKNGAWQQRGFSNQGDCVSAFNEVT